MGKRCDFCDRGSTKGASRSHSKIKTLKRQRPNLQSIKIKGGKKKICTACLRTVAKNKKYQL